MSTTVSTYLKRCATVLMVACAVQIVAALWETTRFATLDACLAVGLIMFGAFTTAVLTALIGLVALIVSWLFRSPSLWRVASYLVLLPFCYLISGVAAQPIQDRLRHRQLATVLAQGNKLVSAITEYQRVHGRAPASLGELVPQHLAAVPGTGMAAFPEFRYTPSQEGEWILESPVFVRGASSATLEFRPSHRYAPGSRRIDGWALAINT